MSFKQNAPAWKQSPEFPWHTLWRLQPHTRYLILQKWLELTSLKWTKKPTTITIFRGISTTAPQNLAYSLGLRWSEDFLNFLLRHIAFTRAERGCKSQISGRIPQLLPCKTLDLKAISLRYIYIMDMITIWDSTLLPFTFEICSWSFQPDVPSAPKSKAVTNVYLDKKDSFSTQEFNRFQ